MTPSGIDTVTFHLLAQRLNQLPHRVPRETAMKTCTLPEQLVLSDGRHSWHTSPAKV